MTIYWFGRDPHPSLPQEYPTPHPSLPQEYPKNMVCGVVMMLRMWFCRCFLSFVNNAILHFVLEFQQPIIISWPLLVLNYR
jgi:hypothetical protein